MINSENPIRLVRELKGAPLSIIMVLSLVHQRVSCKYLERATGYTDKPITQALQYLKEVGLVNDTRSGWQLIKEKVMQLPLIMELEEVTNPCNPCQNPLSENRNNSDPLITTTLRINNTDDSVVVSSNNANKAVSTPCLSRKNSDIELNLAELKQHGIARNKRTEALARMSHVNPKYNRSHIKALMKNETKGLAILRMEQVEAPPCSVTELTDKQKRAKYSEWEL